jgi:transposase-like protein
VLTAWRRSGESLAAFAREQGVNVQRLSWWRRRLGDGGKVARVVEPVALIPAMVTPRLLAGGRGRVVVRLAGGVEVEGETSAMTGAWVADLAREVGKVAL